MFTAHVDFTSQAYALAATGYTSPHVMPQFSANISTLFREVEMPARIARAAACGFSGIELQFPYDQDPRALRAQLDRYALPLVLMNFPAGDLLEGGPGLAGPDGNESAFGRALETARSYAQILRPQAMNLLAGRTGPDQDRTTCLPRLREQLLMAAEITDGLGIRLLIEAVNTVDLPGFLVADARQAIELIDDLPQIDLQLQYDCYHMAQMSADPVEQLPGLIDRIGHIQFSDLPDRTEPGLGRLDFDAIFDLVDELGYPGWVGAEYFPTRVTEQTLGWLRARG